MKYTVIVQAAAVLDAENIRADLALHNPEYVDRWINELDATLRDLAEFPNRFTRAPESARSIYEIRQVVVGRYRVLYAVHGNFVRVHRIRHAAQRPFKPGELN